MANRLYNKQVSPKGYKMGGRTGKMGGGMMMQRPMMEKGGSLKAVDDKKRKSKKIEANKAEYKKLAKDISPEVAMYLKHGKDFPGFDKARRIRGGLKKGGTPKKRGKDFMSTYIADDARKIGGRGGGADSGKAGEVRSKLGKQEIQMKKDIKNFGKKVKDIVTLKKFHDFAEKQYIKSLKEGKTNRGTAEPIGKRRVRRMGGGSLKAVQPNQKGLKKLPTEVRNKMGYMKKGGKVHGK